MDYKKKLNQRRGIDRIEYVNLTRTNLGSCTCRCSISLSIHLSTYLPAYMYKNLNTNLRSTLRFLAECCWAGFP